MDEIESLCRLCEAVETAGADIAPTYAEYVQLAFAIATDCGEAGREFFHRLCRVSANTNGNMPNGYSLTHLLPGMEMSIWALHSILLKGRGCDSLQRGNDEPPEKCKNAGNAPSKNLTHTHVYNKVDNEEPDESEELQDGVT